MFISESVIFPYSINKFDIAKNYSNLWFNLKLIYIIIFIISSFFIYNFIFNKFINEKINRFLKLKKPNIPSSNKKNNFELFLGNSDNTNLPVSIPLKGLYQNILVTGTIGSRKNKFCHISFL